MSLSAQARAGAQQRSRVMHATGEIWRAIAPNAPDAAARDAAIEVAARCDAVALAYLDLVDAIKAMEAHE